MIIVSVQFVRFAGEAQVPSDNMLTGNTLLAGNTLLTVLSVLMVHLALARRLAGDKLNGT